MKQFFVATLLAFGMFFLMIFLDLKMGVTPNGVIWKTINPFRVMEPAEYIIVILFILFFLLQALLSFIKKKRQSSPPSN
ncbi:hypothetical protein J1P26_19205 [Neobacillus sp. MM2021_6]|uniref:hypothetical protein n=1 Tax=Bacillaceae TaxID=186817 RepID=UPI00140C442A|nr:MULTISPECIES: hypothetical protein [Bacillaceae]MBO0961837.1 hypothetical protein [Neobacillus sp. MM2021_6]NHC20258.1 hypothetical protein [Bacillus sp. MM2020_4]